MEELTVRVDYLLVHGEALAATRTHRPPEGHVRTAQNKHREKWNIFTLVMSSKQKKKKKKKREKENDSIKEVLKH